MIHELDDLWPCHLPPDGFEPKSIVDLGVHHGLTVRDFNRRWPDALILGAELDLDNYAKAVKSTENIPNIKLVNIGIADWDGFCSYAKNTNSNAHYILDWNGSAPVMRLDTFLEAFWETNYLIDYIKIDVEGSEQGIIQQMMESPFKFKCINVELHKGYTVQAAKDDLRSMGYTVTVHPYTDQGNTWHHLIGLRKS